MRVIIVDDTNEKVEKVLHSLIGRGGLTRDDIDVAYTVFDARQLLSSANYDLLVIDVLLPLRPGDPPSAESSINLMTELRDRSSLKKPRHIIGLTAFDEGMAALKPIFQQQAWTIIKFDPASLDWSEQLGRAVDWIANVAAQPEARAYAADLCIIAALDVPEFDAILRNGWTWDPAEPVDDTTFARRASFKSGGRDFTAVAAYAPKMGMIASALTVTKLIQAFRPRYIGMAGICAGVKGKANYGDPIVADPCWDWQSGKHVLKEGTREFEIAPDQIPLAAVLRSRWEQLRGDRDYWRALRDEWPGAPDTDLRVRLGPSVSGSSVLASADIVETIKLQHRALVALEMEAYGVMSAARVAPCPRPLAFSCKSVCDFADDRKDDQWQTYAAFTSARAIREFAERYMHELASLAG